jgi:hypothetical protein
MDDGAVAGHAPAHTWPACAPAAGSRPCVSWDASLAMTPHSYRSFLLPQTLTVIGQLSALK